MPNSQRFPVRLPATDLTVGPGDFPIGSPESRAAARVLMESKKAEQPRISEDGKSMIVTCHRKDGSVLEVFVEKDFIPWE